MMQLSDDFKMVIVLDDSLELGLKTNTAAVLSLTLGAQVEGLIGDDLSDKNGTLHRGLTMIPLPILKATTEQLHAIYEQTSTLHDELLIVDVTDAAQTTVTYADYEAKLTKADMSDLKLLGIALAGPKKLVNKYTGSLGLVR